MEKEKEEAERERVKAIVKRDRGKREIKQARMIGRK
jgi:hypothetical protein